MCLNRLVTSRTNKPPGVHDNIQEVPISEKNIRSPRNENCGTQYTTLISIYLYYL